MNAVTVQENEILLNSSLDEMGFGRTNYFTLLSETGLIFHNKQFESWCFENVKALKSEMTEDNQNPNDIVHYWGYNPLGKNAKTLLEYFDQGGEELFNAVKLVVTAMTEAALNSINLPIVGAGGIIVDLQNEKILFLPENIFKYSTNPRPRETYFYEHGGWFNPTITGVPAICYQRGLIVYKLLTNHFPYGQFDEIERNADILDKNFLPIEMIIPEIDQNFARDINRSLELNSTSISIPGKNKKGLDSEDLKVKTDFNFQELEKAWELRKNTKISEEELAEKTSSYLKAKRAKIEAKRKLRRYTSSIIVTVCIAVFIIAMIISVGRKQNAQYTTKGLTSIETIQGFFQGINSKSLDLLSGFVNGHTPEKYVNSITQVYLLEKQLMSFTRDNEYSNPAMWFLQATDNERISKIRVFGISNLTINEEPKEMNIQVHRKNQHPEPVTEENNTVLTQNQTVSHKVEYYMIQTNPENFVPFIQKFTDYFTLTYTNGKWLITDINSNQELVQVDFEEFKKDYFYQLTLNQGNPILAANSIRDKYKWIPSETELMAELPNKLEEY